MINFTVPNDYAPQKARYFLAAYAKVSTNLWKKIKWHGHLYINGKEVHAASAVVNASDTISYEIDTSSQIIPCDKPLDIIYEDDWLLVINKPANQLIHPTTKDHSDTLVNIVVNYYQESQQTHIGCHPVYRLDRNTTGLVIVAKQPQIQYALTTSHDKICRFYQALVQGRPQPAEAMLCQPISRKPDSIIERIVNDNGQSALTRYKVLSSNDYYSLVCLKLYSGRTHQIRVHMSHCGHPLLGDDLYGGDCTLIERQALHAYHIIFEHPINHKKIDIKVPLPADMQNILDSYK